MTIVIGTAGWSIPSVVADAFPAEGPALQRYATRFGGAEINSSFHRPHRTSTWARWAASVPDLFRFSVKLPKTITHGRKLIDAVDLLEAHLADASHLGNKLAVHLVQLPPSLAFDPEAAEPFFSALRERSAAAIACEPRHASWFEPAADRMLVSLQVARVAADPARVPEAAEPGGWQGLIYYRWHGSPVIYRSSYDERRLSALADRLQEQARAVRPSWCIFDNTASSAATDNALWLAERLTPSRARVVSGR